MDFHWAWKTEGREDMSMWVSFVIAVGVGGWRWDGMLGFKLA